MREFELYDGYITVPDEIVFAFNPCFLHIRDISEKKVTIFVTDADGQQVARILLHLYDKSADVDISAYLRSEFAGIAKRTDIFSTTATLSVSIGTVSFNMTVIYGAMLPGEVFNPSRTVRLWSAYPQVVSYFLPKPSEATLYFQRDEQMPQQAIMMYWQGAMIDNYDNSVGSAPMQKSGQIIIAPKSEGTMTSFAMQFDCSFTGIDGNTIINITVDNRPQCDDHIFLRWLDKWGFWQYWLCKIGSVEVSDAVVGSALTFLTGTTYPYYATRNIGKSMVKQVSACATNLTEEEWKMLSTIKGSVNVCAFDTASQSWVPVNVAAGASTWKMGNQSSHRQDFPLKVVFPTIQTQRL